MQYAYCFQFLISMPSVYIFFTQKLKILLKLVMFLGHFWLRATWSKSGDYSANALYVFFDDCLGQSQLWAVCCILCTICNRQFRAKLLWMVVHWFSSAAGAFPQVCSFSLLPNHLLFFWWGSATLVICSLRTCVWGSRRLQMTRTVAMLKSLSEAFRVFL